MKKEEAIAKLSNTKVYVDGKSKEIQIKLFELGFRWVAQTTPVFCQCDKPFLFLDEDLIISQSESMNFFKGSERREIKADDILSITIDNEYEFDPFERVLVRNCDDDIWKADLFSNINKDASVFKFCAISSCWKQCIPYEGHEHLLGTTYTPIKYWSHGSYNNTRIS